MPTAPATPSDARRARLRRTLVGALGAVPWWPALGQSGTPDPRPVIEWPELTLLDGRRWSPASWQGQPSVVVFWATWCAFCLRHNAHVERLHRQGHPMRVLGVALDSDADAVGRYLRQHGYTFPVVADGGRLRSRVTSRRVIPMTALLDRDGRLLQAIPGEMAADDVMGLAPALLRLRG